MEINRLVYQALQETLSLLGDKKHIASVLVYGVPGAGKTFTIERAAKDVTQEPCDYVRATVIDFCSKFFTENRPFDDIISANLGSTKPLFLFLDDLEFINAGPRCRQLRKEFISLFKDDPRRSNILLVGATQKPWVLDEDILNCFDKKLYIGMPDAGNRKHILEEKISSTLPGLELSSENMDEVVQKTSGYTCADLTVLIMDAAGIPLRRLLQSINSEQKLDNSKADLTGGSYANIPEEDITIVYEPEHILSSLSSTAPSIPEDEVRKFICQCQEVGLPT